MKSNKLLILFIVTLFSVTNAIGNYNLNSNLMNLGNATDIENTSDVNNEESNLLDAPVFVLTSNHPIIGSWVDGHVTLSGAAGTYSADVTEFDNLITGVEFGNYQYTFSQANGCFPDVTGTLMVNNTTIDPMSGNVLLSIVDLGTSLTSAPVFVSTSNHPIIGSWVDGNVTLTGPGGTYSADVTEFDNIIPDVAFGTYSYTFLQAGGCYPAVTGTLVVDCDAIEAQSGNIFFPIVDTGSSATSAPVFVSTSNHPIIGSWVDGNITLSGAGGTYSADVTEFDNIIPDVAFGTYNYTFLQAGGCYPAVTGTLVVDCDAIEAQSGNIFFPIVDTGSSATSAPVFVSTSNHPIIGSWVDGNITLSGAGGTYSADVTEFDNIIPDVVFGTYNYSFLQAGGCYPAVTGTLVVDCDAIEAQSGNIFFPIVDTGSSATSAPVFVSTSNHPIIGSWVDGNITLSGAGGTYSADVTEFDNIIPDVVFGTYNYTFLQSGGCYPAVTGTLVVDCDAIEAQSGNIFFPIVDTGSSATSAPVFVSTSSHPIIGAWVDGNVTLTGPGGTYSADVTEFDNIIPDVAFGTYSYTFLQAGGCYPAVTGTLVVDCDGISPMSGNIFFSIIDQGSPLTSAPVFVSTSSHPIIGAWVDGNVTLTGPGGTYSADVTEFDNIIPDVAFGTYSYTFLQAGGCYPAVTGTLVVDCDGISPMSGNIFFSIIDQGINTDLNASGNVDGEDFSIFLGNFGLPCSGPCPTDFNLDGMTDGEDFSIFLGNYGLACD